MYRWTLIWGWKDTSTPKPQDYSTASWAESRRFILTTQFTTRRAMGGYKWQKQQELSKFTHTQALCHAFAGRRHGYHDLKDPGDINVETTMEYLYCPTRESNVFSPPIHYLHTKSK
jgi:hypothetical protein